MFEPLPNFVGGYTKDKDRNISGATLVNLFIETYGSGTKKDGALCLMPGFEPVWQFNSDIITTYNTTWGECVFILANGKVIGTFDFKLYTTRYTISNPSEVYITDDGYCIYISDCSNLYIIDKTKPENNKTLVPQNPADEIEDTIPFYPRKITISGQWLVCAGRVWEDTGDTGEDANQIFYTLYNQNTSWESLRKSFRPQTFKGGIKDIQAITGLIYILGETGIESWQSTGSNTRAFTVISGGFVGTEGVLNKGQSVTNNNILFYLGTNGKGSVGAYIIGLGTSQVPVKVSIPQIEEEWKNFPDFKYAYVEGYSWMSHHFYHITFPDTDKTYVYDIDSQKWAMRESYTNINPEIAHKWPLMYHFAKEQFVYGCIENTIYKLAENEDEHYYDGTIVPIRRVRRSPMLWKGHSRILVNTFAVDMQGGMSRSLVEDQQVRLRVSRDNGYTWGPYMHTSLGKQGEYNRRAQWRRIGLGRPGLTFELSWNDKSLVKCLGAFYSGTVSNKDL
jgi:hypothetical protein